MTSLTNYNAHVLQLNLNIQHWATVATPRSTRTFVPYVYGLTWNKEGNQSQPEQPGLSSEIGQELPKRSRTLKRESYKGLGASV